MTSGGRMVDLGSVATFEMGQAPPGAASNFDGVGTLFVKAGEFGALHPLRREWTTQPLKFGQSGDVFICVVGATAGKLNLGIDCAIGRSVAAIRPGPSVNTRFLYYQLLLQVEAMRVGSRGSAQGVISRKDLASIQVVVPPLGEQRHIVELLEDHLSRLDAADLWLATNLSRSSRLREGLFERRFVTEPPIGSRRRTLADLIEVGRTMSYGVLVPGPDTAGGIPMVRVGDIRGGLVHTAGLKRISPSVSDKFPRTLLHGGELLLSLVGTIGRVGVAPASLAGANVARAVGVLPLSHEVDARYIAYALQAPSAQRDLEGRAHEVARKTLNLEDLRRVVVPVPHEDVQRLVVAELDEQLAAVALMEIALRSAQERSSGLRRSLLEAAFAGRLVRQHPADVEM